MCARHITEEEYINSLYSNNFTYARNIEALVRLQNDFFSKVANMLNIINGEKYEGFKNIVKSNWQGVDCDDFLNDVELTRKQFYEKLRLVANQFHRAIVADIQQFEKFQYNNKK